MDAFHKCTVVALYLLLISCSGSKKIVQSHRAHQMIVIDGKLADWQQPMQQYHAATSLWYSIRNDDTKLYLCIVASDETIQTKIAIAGLQIIIDTLGGHNKHMLVQYPAGTDLKQPVPSPATPPNNRPRLVRELMAQSTMLRVAGFENKRSERLLSLQNTSGIKVAVDWTNEGYMVYELMLPISIEMTTATAGKVGVQMIVKGLPLRQGIASLIANDSGQSPLPDSFLREGSPGITTEQDNDEFNKNEVIRFVVQLENEK